MDEIARSKVPVGACTTLAEASRRMGMDASALKYHKRTAGSSFPRMVARFGRSELYVYDELLAYHRSVMWRQADKHIKELMEGGDAA